MLIVPQWLPNQLQAVLEQMTVTESYCKTSTDLERIMDLVNLQKLTLKKDVDRYCSELEA